MIPLALIAAAALGAPDGAGVDGGEAPAAPSKRVAVWVQPAGLEARRLEILEAYVMDELRKLSGLDAVRVTEAAGASSVERCREQEGCLAAIQSRLGTRSLLTVKATGVHDSDVLTLKLFDIDSGEVVEVATLSAAREDGALSVLGPAVQRIFPGHAPRRALGVAPEAAARWNPEVLPSWVFWTTAAAAVTAAAAATVSGSIALAEERRYHDLADQGLTGEVRGADLKVIENSANAAATVTNVTWGLTALFAITAVTTFFFTDFGSDAVMTPVLTVDGFGAALTMKWR